MGQCKVVRPIGDGEYIVTIEFDNSRVLARIAELTELIKTLVEDKLPAALDKLNAARIKYRAEFQSLFEAGGITPRELLEIETANQRALIEFNKAAVEYEVVQADIKSMEAERERLQAETAEPLPVSAWCADYSRGLPAGTELGSIEIPGERKGVPVIIQPGYGGNAPVVPERDGKISPAANATPEGFFWNLAMLPAWQKWRPLYRLGTIVELDKENDLADVVLDVARSSQQLIDVNQDLNLLQIPVRYMNCNARAFEVGRRVVVHFIDQDFAQPEVIGFEDNPVPCMLVDYLALPVNDEQPDGYGNHEPQLFRLTSDNATWQASLEAVWSESETPDALNPTQTGPYQIPDPENPGQFITITPDPVPALPASAFGNVDWRGTDGTVLSWWGSPSRYFASNHVGTFHGLDTGSKLFGQRLPDREYPGHVWGYYKNLLVVKPDMTRESVFQQRTVYRDGLVYATTPEPVFGAATTLSPTGDTWLIAACGDIRDTNKNPPVWTTVNDLTEKSIQDMLADTFTYVRSTVFYAAPMSDLAAWIEIGRLDYNDAIVRTSGGFSVAAVTNRSGWFFSGEGTKAVSMKAPDVTLLRAEASVSFPVEDDFGDPIPPENVIPVAEFTLTSDAESVKSTLTSGLTLSNPVTNTGTNWIGHFGPDLNQAYTRADTTRSSSGGSDRVYAYDYVGEVMVELALETEGQSTGVGFTELTNVTNSPTVDFPLRHNATGYTAGLTFTTSGVSRFVIRETEAPSTARSVVWEDTSAVSVNATIAVTFGQFPDPGDVVITGSNKRVQNTPEPVFVDLRTKTALFKVFAVTDFDNNKTASYSGLWLWEDGAYIGAWNLRDETATAPTQPPEVPASTYDSTLTTDAPPNYVNQRVSNNWVVAFVGGEIQALGPGVTRSYIDNSILRAQLVTEVTDVTEVSDPTPDLVNSALVLGSNELVAAATQDSQTIASGRFATDPSEYLISIPAGVNDIPIETEVNYIDVAQDALAPIDLITIEYTDTGDVAEPDDKPDRNGFLTMVQPVV